MLKKEEKKIKKAKKNDEIDSHIECTNAIFFHNQVCLHFLKSLKFINNTFNIFNILRIS